MEIFQYEFMQKAFIVGILISIIIPMVGTIIVLKRLSMMGDALSHSSLAGIAGGLVAGINAVKLFNDEEVVIFPKTTAIGSLPYYITHTDSKHFQPMNVTFGIVEELEGPRIRDKKERYTKVAERALNSLTDIISKDNL